MGTNYLSVRKDCDGTECVQRWAYEEVATLSYVFMATENHVSARASGSFGSKTLLQKRRGLPILLKQFWELLYVVCEVLVIFY